MSATDGFKVFWEQLTVERVDYIGDYYAEDAYFRDPFNEVRWLPEIQRIFYHMFVQLHEPHLNPGDRRAGHGRVLHLGLYPG
jgi:steroid delta-isomerase